MNKERIIQVVARQVSFKEAEELDDKYYSAMSHEKRLQECLDLRLLNFFGGDEKNIPAIRKVVTFRKIKRNGKTENA